MALSTRKYAIYAQQTASYCKCRSGPCGKLPARFYEEAVGFLRRKPMVSPIGNRWLLLQETDGFCVKKPMFSYKAPFRMPFPLLWFSRFGNTRVMLLIGDKVRSRPRCRFSMILRHIFVKFRFLISQHHH